LPFRGHSTSTLFPATIVGFGRVLKLPNIFRAPFQHIENYLLAITQRQIVTSMQHLERASRIIHKHEIREYDDKFSNEDGGPHHHFENA